MPIFGASLNAGKVAWVVKSAQLYYFTAFRFSRFSGCRKINASNTKQWKQAKALITSEGSCLCNPFCLVLATYKGLFWPQRRSLIVPDGVRLPKPPKSGLSKFEHVKQFWANSAFLSKLSNLSMSILSLSILSNFEQIEQFQEFLAIFTSNFT